jgi:peptide-methionine (S)-S-oxide reductase
MIQEATFGAGCFWCIEACYDTLNGVVSVHPGYAGGHIENPSYKEVCKGNTGHAEVARITFDDNIISFEQLLKVFWFIHDPTQLNRQGNDVGTHYRSVIFYHNEEQEEKAKKFKNQLEDEKVWELPVVTEISKIENYFPAESYHKDYFELNPDNPYCNFVVRPKVEKFKSVFGELLK